MISAIGRLFAPTRFPIEPVQDADHPMNAGFIHEHGDSDVLKHGNFPSPVPSQGSNQIVVNTVAAGVNPVDFKLRKGPIANFLFPKPKVLGADMAGIVAFAPEGSPFKVGERVMAMLPFLGTPYGSYAEKCCVDEFLLVPAPTNFSLVELASIPLVATTVIQAMRPAKLAYGDRIKGKRCFIAAGSGGVGTFAIQYCAKELGMYVTTSCSEKNFELVQSLGASEVVNYKTEKIEDRIHDYDVFLDTMGYRHEELVINAESKILKPSTAMDPSFYIRIASSPYGDKSERLSPDPLGLAVSEARLDRMFVAYTKQFLSSFNILPKGIRYHFVLVYPEKQALEEAAKAIQNGIIRPVIQDRIPLSEAKRAHDLLEQGHVTGKLVLVVNDKLEK